MTTKEILKVLIKYEGACINISEIKCNENCPISEVIGKREICTITYNERVKKCKEKLEEIKKLEYLEGL